jgi:hypothetical protein
MGEYYNKSIERFHLNGWPAQLQKKLNYNKLINISKGGTGESYQLKRFIEEFGGIYLSKEYDVLVVWLSSPQGRMSFYANGGLYNIMTSHPYEEKTKESDFAKAYINIIENVELDTSLEQVFYIKTLKEICNGKNYNFLIFPLSVTDSKLHQLLDIKENMGKYYTFPPYKSIIPDLDNPKYSSILKCHHPNELGYELIAERMIEIINKYNPNLINNTEPVPMEMEWREKKIFK